MSKEKFKRSCYEAYKLNWMIAHGYSIKDYLYAIADEDENARAEGDYPEGSSIDIYEDLHDRFESETGFKGSIWACYEEFLENEFADAEYMDTLLSTMPDCMKMKALYKSIFPYYHGPANPVIEVRTSAGILKAEASTDPGQPGISVVLQPAGTAYEIDTAYISVYEDASYATSAGERPEDVVIMSYGDPYSEEYTRKDILRREDVLEAVK